MKSEVQQFYEAVQAKLGGTVPWEQLHPLDQIQFTEACNVIFQIGSINR